DHNDLMDAVDHVLDQGYIDEDNLFITGGSGGGVLSSWAIGKTNRFAGAVVAKPVINWYSFVLTADGSPYYSKYWFTKKPWEDPQQYLERSPISLVGNVTTPTMLLTGEQDYRTPMSESEQYYAALKLQGVDATLVRIQGSGHGIAGKPSNLFRKVAYILGWFEKYKE
ncbi:MAG TPA: peptidase S9 family protein, partial [Balneolaceae bacterium]|nr:peptidase S9 family protein [Balneolaceae bacterium]